ncbi:hypothetical protein AWU67_12495 [Microterricola viridarii]|uniref:Uncharacterized protein n=1 Tax=Microterricola viridarii TaxID=412690 RepID=A0A0X8E4U0_9MICO|nr:hypothetical protein AWU67_12495 [Microterricola viridarii]
MPAPEEVRDRGSVGPIDIDGKSAYVSFWVDSTLDGTLIEPGNWYSVQNGNGCRYGFVHEPLAGPFRSLKAIDGELRLVLLAGDFHLAIRAVVNEPASDTR